MSRCWTGLRVYLVTRRLLGGAVVNPTVNVGMGYVYVLGQFE
jgi:hypothetical protein